MAKYYFLQGVILVVIAGPSLDEMAGAGVFLLEYHMLYVSVVFHFQLGVCLFGKTVFAQLCFLFPALCGSLPTREYL